ncbi:hypothetical protein [Microbacter margulisiae]|uniref:O-antigen ligase like membrane protein n=1 Tax=Microbacter margulisiae TaxID=1350067 RepID=A0A7W5DS20_9PORP|nr:hypothetical protein [Microbacter margulisiae]MBB3187198.1 hypothetical protein [Microbacter margulisiae]
MSKTSDFLHSRYLQIFSLSCILIETCGIRFFQGLGSLLLCLVIVFNLRYVKKIRIYGLLLFAGLIIIFSILQYSKNGSVESTLNTVLIMVASYMFSLSYIGQPQQMLIDLYVTLRLFIIHAFISIFVFIILHPLIRPFLLNGMPYVTIYYLFYYFIPNDGFPRITGLFWEPGTLQFLANVFLFISIYNGKKLKHLMWIVVVVVFTISSTGFVLLMINALFFMNINRKMARMNYSIVFISIIVMFFMPVLSNAIYSKLTTNLSGLIRFSNTYVEFKLLMLHPLVGVDFNVHSLIDNIEFNNIEEAFWGANSPFLPYKYGSIPGGLTNGFLGLLLNWGLFIGIYIYYLFYKSKFFPSSKYASYFLLLVIVANMSEGLTDTAFFYIFVISTLVFGKRNIKIYNKKPLVDDNYCVK